MNKNDSGLSRREFIEKTTLCAAAAMVPAVSLASVSTRDTAFPLIDFHVHPNANLTIEDAVANLKSRNMQCGIAEHPGRRPARGEAVERGVRAHGRGSPF